MIVSEKIIPCFSHIIDEMIQDIENLNGIEGDEEFDDEIYSLCQNLWLASDAMNKLTCCFKNGGVAVSIAITNERQKIANFIQFKIGVDPILNKDFASWS